MSGRTISCTVYFRTLPEKIIKATNKWDHEGLSDDEIKPDPNKVHKVYKKKWWLKNIDRRVCKDLVTILPRMVDEFPENRPSLNEVQSLLQNMLLNL